MEKKAAIVSPSCSKGDEGGAIEWGVQWEAESETELQGQKAGTVTGRASLSRMTGLSGDQELSDFTLLQHLISAKTSH